MTSEDLDHIVSLPTLAVSEFPNGQPGWLVQISSISKIAAGWRFEFEKLPGAKPIQLSDLQKLQIDLDISKMEVFRHHYSLKKIDLNAVLGLEHASYPSKKVSEDQTQVFIVHGHDHTLRDEVQSFLREQGLEPVIMSEHANMGDPLTTKFIRVAQSAIYAVILLTPDDLGRANNAISEQPRARQNVVFELGYFIGKLGPSRVALVSTDDVEHPTDYAGIGRISHSPDGSWKNYLRRELEAAAIL